VSSKRCRWKRKTKKSQETVKISASTDSGRAELMGGEGRGRKDADEKKKRVGEPQQGSSGLKDIAAFHCRAHMYLKKKRSHDFRRVNPRGV